MGNCCSGNANEGEVKMTKGPTFDRLHEQLFDNREILGLRGKEKMRIIVKIQALFRGSLARKKTEQRFGFRIRTMGGHYGNIVEPNYQNPKVQEIKERLGPFKYGSAQDNDGVRRKHRALITLENGARYEGHWNEDTNKRDGRGY